MTPQLALLGENPRLRRALEPLALPRLSPEDSLRRKAILFAVAVDDFGADPAFYTLLRRLRAEPDALEGAVVAMVVDGTGELYTKAAAQALTLAATMAGAYLPGRALVEATGSLYNHHIQAANWSLSWEETYFRRVRELAARLAEFTPPRFDRPKVLMLHASEQRRSNTLALGRAVLERLAPHCDLREIALLNGAVHDCRGCGYHQCLHFAQNATCFYGGALSEEVFPAIRASDLLLFLCPNYNDALGANLVALINRMTGLVLKESMGEKYVAGVVASGYSGGDVVARQLLGAMCLNRGFMLPPRALLLETAHDPGDAMRAAGIEARLHQFAASLLQSVSIAGKTGWK